MLTLLRDVFFKKSNAQHDPEMSLGDYSPTREGINALNDAEKQDFDSRHGALQESPTARSGYTITTGQSSTSQDIKADHIRCNLDQCWVSAEDALQYMRPDIMPYQIKAAIDRLPRAAIVKAVWPPTKKGRRGRACADTLFDAVALDNLYMLFDDDNSRSDHVKRRYRDDVLHKIQQFVTDIMNMQEGWAYEGSMVMLASDAKKSSAQLRFERDVRERVTKGPDYYEKQRVRNAKFRGKQAKAVPQPICVDCGKQGFHYSFCRQLSK